ncbi:hypothetical protein NS228_05895 [Methylobacterium indicum]|uniref:hypothetical protein n=1 Tax=Methylobacterium indicum TaxID=1775910 RepID=UPI0007341D12|nr:hypothetical protein [Methylobacterium indicum]KTS30912.1 hypothetical protein NS229_14940 [Methylobacterium indicum]KTS41501.1 hypothetical protein NS228_05895 [Methylobacterium indicum]KTS52445.1 hypothetical protein NS230_10020 [Methylobacterium indicum]
MPKVSALLPLSPLASPRTQAAVQTARLDLLRKNRLKRRRYAAAFVEDPRAFDQIREGLADLPAGARNDALRRFVQHPDGPIRVEPECIHAALVVARALCWLDLHR